MTSDDVITQISTTNQFAGTKEEITNNMLATGPAVFNDNTSGDIIDIPDVLDDIADIDHIGQSDLDKFFARPIRIHSDTWANTIDDVISPWDAYLNNSLIKNKLINYAYIRARLHLKILVNSTPFNYGALQASYYPYCLDQSEINYGINGFARASKVPSALRVYLQSTLPHIVIEPSKNRGGEMVIPFIYDRNWLELKQRTAIQRMGKLSIRELSAIQSANDGTPEATVTIFAWLEDVKLTGASTETILQSDAYGSGPISKPASVVANMANRLSSAPVIGKYATATGIAATAVGRIASMFGFSNIPLIEPIRNVRNSGFGNMASSEIGSHIEKLTLDPKNEITIDPKTLGATGDDMNISNLVQREGLVAVTNFATTQAVDTQIAATPVHTSYSLSATESGYTCYYLPPLTHVSMPFGFWRGDIIYRFKAITTPYHKGRLRITWDTKTQPVRTADGYQNSLTTVWDLSETDEIEFSVPYQNETAFLPVRHTLSPDGFALSANATVTDTPYSNGVLSLVVVNKLTAPVDVSSVDILIYVRAAVNMEFADPVNPLSSGTEVLTTSFLEPQSDAIKSIAFKEDDRSDDNIYKVHFGEVVKSIKVLMYRSNLLYTGGISNNTLGERVQVSLPRLPLYYGYDYNGINSAQVQAGGSNKNYNWVRTSPYHWFASSFVFQRGGHNYRITFRGSEFSVSATRVPYTGVAGLTSNSYRTAQNLGFDINGRGNMITGYHNQSSGSGTSVAVSTVNPTVEFCSPFYSRYRAVTNDPKCVNQPPYSFSNSVYTNNAYGESEESSRSGYNLEGFVITAWNLYADYARYEIYHSVGIDFSLAFYRGCPALYSQTLPLAPV